MIFKRNTFDDYFKDSGLSRFIFNNIFNDILIVHIKKGKYNYLSAQDQFSLFIYYDRLTHLC